MSSRRSSDDKAAVATDFQQLTPKTMTNTHLADVGSEQRRVFVDAMKIVDPLSLIQNQ